MPGPLDGINILEFTQIIAAPFGGMLLSDMGANVIKIEPVEGEPWRLHSQFLPKESRTYMGLNRGKKSLPLNLKDSKSVEIIEKIVESIDVVIINARPDVPKTLGIDYETLSTINPNIIYCDNTAFGRKGPYSQHPGYDIVVQAMSGLLAADNKMVDGVPQQVSATAVADYGTGISIAWSICAALFSRERTGKGQKIDTTLLGTALSMQGSFFELNEYTKQPRLDFLNDLSTLRQAGIPYETILKEQQEQSGATGGTSAAFRIYYTTYATSDGVIALGCLSDQLRKKAADAIGLKDPRFYEGYDPESPEMLPRIHSVQEDAKEKISAKSTNEWLSIFETAGVPAGPVKFIQELFDDEQVIANDMIVEVEHSTAGKIRMVGPIVQMSETPLKAQSASPALGEHTDEILENLGYTPELIEELKRTGVTR